MAERAAVSGESRLSRVEFERWFAQRIAARDPVAVVRLGDGEKRLLDASADDDESMVQAKSQLERETGRVCASAVVLEVKAALERAYNQADVLGFPADVAVPDSGCVPHTFAVYYDKRLAAGRPRPLLADALLGHEILPKLPALLRGRLVSVISCRDIAPVLEDRWGLEDVAVYQVPSQHACRHLDGDYEARMRHVPIWPDAHADIESRLAVREPGEVFLIGAGVFGKDLCIRARDAGGIGLDMGAALDHIAGKLTRVLMREIMELHAEGASVPDIAATLGGRQPERIREFIDSIAPYMR